MYTQSTLLSSVFFHKRNELKYEYINLFIQVVQARANNVCEESVLAATVDKVERHIEKH